MTFGLRIAHLTIGPGGPVELAGGIVNQPSSRDPKFEIRVLVYVVGGALILKLVIIEIADLINTYHHFFP
jgi:hypothetical protein